MLIYWRLRFGLDFSGSWSVVFWSKLRLEWISLVVMAGPGLGQSCFACPPFGVAFGMVCGASDRSPVVNSNDRISCYRFPVARSSCGLLVLKGCYEFILCQALVMSLEIVLNLCLF